MNKLQQIIFKYPDLRGSGRTTAIAFEMIGYAMNNPNTPLSMCDHSDGNIECLLEAINNIIEACDLKFFSRYIDGNSVIIEWEV